MCAKQYITLSFFETLININIWLFNLMLVFFFKDLMLINILSVM
jgi:hypothetical protein